MQTSLPNPGTVYTLRAGERTPEPGTWKKLEALFNLRTISDSELCTSMLSYQTFNLMQAMHTTSQLHRNFARSLLHSSDRHLIGTCLLISAISATFLQSFATSSPETLEEWLSFTCLHCTAA